MLRYCPKCRKSYEFDPAKVAGAASLTCPECGGSVPKNSRAPSEIVRDREGYTKTDAAIGNTIRWLYRLSYMFYFVVSLIGLIGYFTRLSIILYIAAGICMLVFLSQLVTRTLVFRQGVYLLPLGAALGYQYLWWDRLDRALAGVLIVFIIRHIVRRIIWKLFAWLIKLGNSK